MLSSLEKEILPLVICPFSSYPTRSNTRKLVSLLFIALHIGSGPFDFPLCLLDFGLSSVAFSSYQRERERGIAKETGYAILACKKKGISGDGFAIRKVPRSDRLEDFTRAATGCAPLV